MIRCLESLTCWLQSKIELLEPKRPEEVGRTKDPKYCDYQRIISHLTKDYFILKDKIQALVEVGVLLLNEKRSK